MKSTLTKTVVLFAAVFGIVGAAVAQEDPAIFLGRANARVARAQGYSNHWEGPVAGPKAASSKVIVFIGADLRDKGTARVASGVKEAGAAVGWNVQVVDCYGVPGRRAEAFSRALALKPDGIVLAGADARNQTRELAAAAKLNVPVVGWHAATRAVQGEGLFTNVGTDPREVGQIAALYGVVESKGRAGVVVFVDSSSAYAAAKSVDATDVIKQCQTCSLLSVEEVPATETIAQFRQRITDLSKRFGNRWTHMIGMNDLYFDLLTAPGADPAMAATLGRLQAIAAGDGSDTAYQRIRNKQLQIGTIPEPLNLQGWQIVDELNRAIAGVKPSGYTSPAYLATIENNAFHGGSKNAFDPGNGYRDEYRKIWLK
ncbi:ribose transport system substrate-binding protein [Actimicrobium sp. GrIS 1.19]|uniref:substrate-binding domain-containing protein n=1 Tax=Actimicrobium sp. GrIS 1.19 TaxID=3071708 RepID=UPI002E0331E6|nr:ribose transport system substrate-binding protein [Actimicrobium sp. GrIS 1.19]